MTPLFYLLALLTVQAAALPKRDATFLKLDLSQNLAGADLRGLANRDRARFAQLFKGESVDLSVSVAVGPSGAATVPATNQATLYTASVSVGDPPTTYQLLVDTGSSNTWLGAGAKYVATRTSADTGANFSVTYGSGSVDGKEMTDRLALSSTLVVPQQSLGIAQNAQGFDGVDGIIGLGPVALTEHTITPYDEPTRVPTVTDNLYAAGVIPENEVSIFFAPTRTNSSVNGEMTFGGVNAAHIVGGLTWAPITSADPAKDYWGVDQSITLGNTPLTEKPILSTTAGIIDTGTSLVLIATDAYNKYVTATGAVFDKNTGLLQVTQAQFKALPDLNFHIGDRTFALTADGQLWPRSLNTEVGGNDDGYYLIVSDSGSPSGSGLDFVNGLVWLERFYTVYDTANARVGFSETVHTRDIFNQNPA